MAYFIHYQIAPKQNYTMIKQTAVKTSLAHFKT